jgi:hypothetical protein
MAILNSRHPEERGSAVTLVTGRDYSAYHRKTSGLIGGQPGTNGPHRFSEKAFSEVTSVTFFRVACWLESPYALSEDVPPMPG